VTRYPLRFSLAILCVAPSVASAQGPPPVLKIDPRLVAEAAEVWGLIAGRENPIWPGWDASDTPILFYLPGEQDVLINHPHPPAGFVTYEGPVRFPGGRIAVRDGPTIIGVDGQNTSRDIEGVRTLVVADALSNLRQRISGLESVQGLSFAQLATDPYDQLGFVAHEAFHVFQDRMAPAKGANEMLLLHYPVLSVENNVGFAQEGAALAAALRAEGEREFHAAVTRWLAVRQHRRAALPPDAVAYEDGAEFKEGLAKYVEYRLSEALEGRQPSPEMWWVQGFHGYHDSAARRSALIATMLEHMRGEHAVNNDPFGTAPLRMRLYYSGMAIAAVLDRLTANWKERILQPTVSLTDLAAEAVSARAGDLRQALDDAQRDNDHVALVAAKQRFAQEGQERIDSMLTRIERGAGTGIIVDYGALNPPRVGLAFTPFGITMVDDDRTIYTQVPIQARFPDGTEVAETEATPFLHDRKRKVIEFRLSRQLSRSDVAGALGEARSVRLELPGVRIVSPRATIQWDGKDLRVILLRRSE
jgi:hypothetical protein